MKKILIALALAGCAGDNVLPTCPEVGCPAGEPLPCRGLDGPCFCGQPDGARVECEREREVPTCESLGCEVDCRSAGSFTCPRACSC